jgi:hypothetical protein
MVRVIPICEKMKDFISSDQDWRAHFTKMICDNSTITKEEYLLQILSKIEKACKWQAKNAKEFRRQTLQTRFFETGDNYYLGMEFPREYEYWKGKLVDYLIKSMAEDNTESTQDSCCRLKSSLTHGLDCLWYEACLETIRTGDVYNPGARHRVPRLYVINSYFDVELSCLPVGESFRLSASPENRYEVLVKRAAHIFARNHEGMISKLIPDTKVRREGNLTRTPDGNTESKVALATFPVSHYVNYRTMRLGDGQKGYVFAFIGDEQATPHFMRYR